MGLTSGLGELLILMKLNIILKDVNMYAFEMHLQICSSSYTVIKIIFLDIESHLYDIHYQHERKHATDVNQQQLKKKLPSQINYLSTMYVIILHKTTVTIALHNMTYDPSAKRQTVLFLHVVLFSSPHLSFQLLILHH